MVKLEIKLPLALKRKLDLYPDIDRSEVARDAFRKTLKEFATAARTIDKSSILRTRLFRIPSKVSTSWENFFSASERKKKR